MCEMTKSEITQSVYFYGRQNCIMRLTGSNIITNVSKMFRQNCPLYILNVDQCLWGNAVQATFELVGILQEISYNRGIF